MPAAVTPSHARPPQPRPTPSRPTRSLPGAARKALVPVLVPASQLHLAATVDSWAWSITGAVGASVGGVVASKLGKSACFLVVSVGDDLGAAQGAAQGCIACGWFAEAAGVSGITPRTAGRMQICACSRGLSVEQG